MTGFFYMHFGDDVPKNIEKEYNRLLLHEQYLEKRSRSIASRQLLLKMLSLYVLILPLFPLTRLNLSGSDFITSV